MSERDDIVTRLRTDDASDDLLISAASLLETDDDEIERLRAEVALWHQLWDNVALDVPDLRDDNKPLAVAASYELLKRDAGRYRWLRNESLHRLIRGPICIDADTWGEPVMACGKHITLDGATLDAAIDAAMEGGK